MKHGLTLFTALIIAISEAVCRPMPATEVAPPTPRTTALLPSPSLASYLEPPLTPGVVSAPTPVSSVTKADQHRVEGMDTYHQSFDVYTDAGREVPTSSTWPKWELTLPFIIPYQMGR